ncbi:MAG: type II toxin-antitoxin system VapC family toxin [Bifidobacteriaceae bacterium]|jgi:PIN domain nuclease of toxin-antitoxin system|nr:type II toxin-antitoxin system VapC family toxin [Bifidobacteriaceae bacterium]
MRAILDTNAFLWAVREPAKLSRAASEVISDRANSLVVPACVSWELAIKHRRGRLPEAAPILADYAGTLARLGGAALAMSDAHTLVAGGMEWDHADPFDRMVVAIAIVENLPIVTADRIVAGAPGVRVIW